MIRRKVMKMVPFGCHFQDNKAYAPMGYWLVSDYQPHLVRYSINVEYFHHLRLKGMKVWLEETR